MSTATRTAISRVFTRGMDHLEIAVAIIMARDCNPDLTYTKPDEELAREAGLDVNIAQTLRPQIQRRMLG